MPTYEYECGACKHSFEVFQSMKDGPLKECPACKRKKLKRLIGTGAGMIFKGGGFYCTDYRSSGYSEAAKSDSKSASPPAASDSKPSSQAPSASDSKKTSDATKPPKKGAA